LAGAAALHYEYSDGTQKVLDRNLYVADFGNGAIRKIVSATGAVSTFLSRVSGISLPSGVATDGAGNLYVADSGYNQITQFVLATMMSPNTFGQVTAGSADGTGSAARFRAPQGVASDGAGNLNRDYEPTYISWSTPTCRNCPHEHAIHSAGRPASPAHSVA
jgi:sugar lactone lactonase YvrE